MGTIELFDATYCSAQSTCVVLDAWLALTMSIVVGVIVVGALTYGIWHRKACLKRFKAGIDNSAVMAKAAIAPLDVIQKDANEAIIQSHKNSLKNGEQFVEQTQRMSRRHIQEESAAAAAPKPQRTSLERDPTTLTPPRTSFKGNSSGPPRTSFSKVMAAFPARFQVVDLGTKRQQQQQALTPPVENAATDAPSARVASDGASNVDANADTDSASGAEPTSTSFRHLMASVFSPGAKRKAQRDHMTSFESPTYERKQELAILPPQSRTQNERRSSIELRDRRRVSVGMNSRLQFQIGNNQASVYEVKLKEINLVKRLAFGPLSEVYAAIWRDTKVGVKVLMPKEGYVDHLEEAVRNFRREIWVMNSFQHPNIVKLIGASLTPRCYVLVMEYMSNGSLYDYLRDEANFMPAQMIITCAFDIAAGMAHIHDCGVLQRDLKSKNCLLSENLIVKVSDFGLARFKSKVYGEYTFVGTPFWAAPEVIRHEEYDEKADVYSFAIVLWELVERKDPYDEYNAFQVPLLVANEGLRPASFTKVAPLGMEQLMKQCWDANPDQRPTFAEIVECLEKWLMPTSPHIERSLDEEDLNTHILRERNTATEEDLHRFATSHNANEKVIPIVLSSRMSEKLLQGKKPSLKRTGSDLSNLSSKTILLK